MNQTEINTLFEEAWNETGNAESSLDLELDQLLLRDFSKEKEEFQILFDLADEAIQNPEAEKRYVEEIKTSETRTLKSNEITEQLSKMEGMLKATIFSLKKGGPRLSQQDDTQMVSGAIEPAKRIIIPSWRVRVKAELFDLSYALFLALLITIFITWFTEPGLREDLLAPARMEPPELACFCALYITIALLTLILYPLFSGPQTTGHKFFRLELLNSRGRTPSQKRILKRSLLYPLSALFIPMRIKKPSIADYLAGLTLSAIPKQKVED